MIFDNTIFKELSLQAEVQSGLHIILTTDEDDARPVYLSGNFNGWCTQDSNFILEKIGTGLYHFNFPVDFDYPDTLQYKFTKGDWSEVEIGLNGEVTENRNTSSNEKIRHEHVHRWRKNWLPYKTNYLPQIQLVSDEFFIPQLNQTTKIWALLPHDYDYTDERYPVIYLQDAQNLFNELSGNENWAIDKKLAVMSEYNVGKIIVIAVENNSYNSSSLKTADEPNLINESNIKYCEFLAQTLKPYIDSNYRTKTDREHTGLGGSVGGANISALTVAKFPDVFSKLLLLSPTLKGETLVHFNHCQGLQQMKVYLYAANEDCILVDTQLESFKQLILEKGLGSEKLDINFSINGFAKQNGVSWGDEFPKAIEWLFFRS